MDGRLIYGFFALVLSAGCTYSSVCGEGFEQQGDACVPACVDECGAHAKCMVTENSAQCECVAGYAGDPCAWSGGLQNPGFTSDESWSKTNGATILPLESGPSGPGIAAFSSIVTCNAGAVAQVVEMPS